jgi:hypothetical protein
MYWVMNRLDKIIQEVLQEEKSKRDRCLRIADRKFDKPSAYKSGAVVRCRKGDIWKGIKESKETNIQDLSYQNNPGLLKKGIENELKFLSYVVGKDFNNIKNSINPQIKRLPLSSIKPSQSGEDYKNPSSEYEAEEFQKILNGEKNIEDHRKEDFYPILVNKQDNKIIDGNHRHYALSAINSPYAVVLYVDIPKQYLNEVKETLRTWFSRKGEPGKKGGWVDCNTCREVDGKTKCKACGREKGEKRSKYPSCRPTPSQCKTPGKGTKWGKTK